MVYVHVLLVSESWGAATRAALQPPPLVHFLQCDDYRFTPFFGNTFSRRILCEVSIKVQRREPRFSHHLHFIFRSATIGVSFFFANAFFRRNRCDQVTALVQQAILK